MLVEVELFAKGKDWRTANTYASYGKKLEHFLTENKLSLSELKPIDIKKFVYEAGTNQEELVMNTAASYKRFIAALMRFIGRDNLVEYIRLNLREIKTENKFAVDLTLDEVLTLINITVQPKLKFAWSVMAFNDLRPGEVLGLFYSDIDVEKKVVRFLRRKGERYYAKGMKVGQQAKTIPLNVFCLALFKQLPFKRGERILNISYKTLRKWFNRYVKQARISRSYPITMHKLRHFFGHYWMRHKGNIRILQKVMRHSDIKYTLLYTEPSEAEVEEEFEAVMSFENTVGTRTR